MPYKITTLEAPNHTIKVKKTETRATLELDTRGFEGLKEDFVLLIGLEELNRPRMW
jgi:poly [ADP-ribose] polymerase